MPKPEYRQNKSIRLQPMKSGKRGSAILETTAGLFILLPVFLCLVDIIALVTAQSINDDLAKQASRYASLVPAYNPDGTMMTQTALQSAASIAASNYLEQQTAYSGSSGTICQASLVGCTFDPVNGVQVTTQIQCNLPIPVPFGPSSTTFQAQFTGPPVDIQPIPQQSSSSGS